MTSKGQPAGEPDADARLRKVYTDEWTWRRTQIPDSEDTLGPVAARLPQVDPASQEGKLGYWTEVLRQLEALPRHELSPTEQQNLDIYRPQIEVLIANQRFRDFEMPVNADTMFWTDLGYTARRPFIGLADYVNWIAQMRDVPRYFREQMEVMRAGLNRKFTPPRITLHGREVSITAVIDASPEECLFYTPFKSMMGLSEAEQGRLRAEAVTVIRESVQPAYRMLLQFMREEYLPGTRTTIAAYDLPDGPAYYRAKIREFTTLNLEPAQIHELGHREVARLHAEMIAVMRGTGFRGDFSQFLTFLRTDPRFYAKSADELLMRASWVAKKFDAKASQFFGYLPRARFAINPVPDDLAPFYTAGRGGPNLYLVNTYDLPSRPLYNLTALTLHESAPGHAFQMSIALEHTDQPQFRQHTFVSAFGEGWALYCEELGEEMGLYETAYDRFGMLGYQIWRAARLVIDTGLHAMQWSREQAIGYLGTRTALQEREIQSEVDRYISWPAQALSYYLGKLAISGARSRAQKALGSQFDLRAFHDSVLELGSVPLPVLEKHIDRFIAQGGQRS